MKVKWGKVLPSPFAFPKKTNTILHNVYVWIQRIHISILLLITIPIAILLYSILINPIHPIYAPCIYTINFILLMAWMLRIVVWIRLIRNKLTALTIYHIWKEDIHLRTRILLYSALLFYVCYATLKCWIGFQYESKWLLTISMYYYLLAVLRFWLAYKSDTRKQDFIHEYKKYRGCGILLVFVNIILSIAVMMMKEGAHYEYPGYLIYVAAMYAFYCLLSAILQVICYRKYHSPLLSASKIVSLVSAMVSMLALQTAMLSTFGQGEIAYQQLMNQASGSCVCTIVFLFAFYMIYKGNKCLYMYRKESAL